MAAAAALWGGAIDRAGEDDPPRPEEDVPVDLDFSVMQLSPVAAGAYVFEVIEDGETLDCTSTPWMDDP